MTGIKELRNKVVSIVIMFITEKESFTGVRL